MFALIKREWKDFLVWEIPAFIMIAILIIINISTVTLTFTDTGRPLWESNMYVYPAFSLLIGLPIYSLIFGIAQMYFDNARKIPTFLVSHAVTRNQVIMAKLIAGSVLIFALAGSLILTQITLALIFPPILPLNLQLLAKIYQTTILISLALYALGIQMENVSGVLLRLSVLVLTAALLALIIIKGLGWETAAILAVFTTASLAKTWARFTQIPL